MAKEGTSDYKKVRKRWFFEETLTEWFFVEPKMVLLWHLSTFSFKKQPGLIKIRTSVRHCFTYLACFATVSKRNVH